VTTAGIVLILSAIIFMALGLPIAFSLGMAGVMSLIVQGNVPLMVFPQRLFTAIDSFPMMAVIFFVMAGEFMLQGGISRRLVNVATCLFWWMRGSLAIISIATCTFFGAISGSGMATTAAVGSLMYPEMTKDGEYDDSFAAAVQAVGGTIGILIPPSVPLIIYGILSNTSIGDLFLAIVVPGIIMSIIYMVTAYIIIRKEGMAKSRTKIDLSIGHALLEGFWALLTPVIILGGIYGGIFTPTEAAAVASVYALIVGIFVYKELDMKRLYKALVSSAIVSASIMLLIAAATFFGWVMTTQGIPQLVSKFIVSIVHTKVAFLIMINILFLIAGMFMETSTSLLLVIPLVFPVAKAFGIDAVHFGVISIVNLSIGLVTPPFGACMFVASGITNVKLDRIIKYVIPFVLTGIIGLLIITFVPVLSAILL